MLLKLINSVSEWTKQSVQHLLWTDANLRKFNERKKNNYIEATLHILFFLKLINCCFLSYFESSSLICISRNKVAIVGFKKTDMVNTQDTSTWPIRIYVERYNKLWAWSHISNIRNTQEIRGGLNIFSNTQRMSIVIWGFYCHKTWLIWICW